ncbi:MAG: family 2 glycosyl transferase [Candidatus Aramenus sulfurataquae]|uniref:Family 2 glycosyl transferase n=1 Tax=Candidatus Aramenus sulfurataquae TaxID=1326980 RepID=W7KY05_9CREN|nr:MAG: family 2 glycosyl transferase [Candidatus Aramenus sulfurataquae]
MSLFDVILQVLLFIIPSLVLLYQFIFFYLGKSRYYDSVTIKDYPFISILVPTKGESVDVIQGLLDNLSQVEWDKSKMEVIIISDDDREYFNKMLNSLRIPQGLEVRLYNREGKEKKGYKSGALAYGFQKSRGELVITLDVDARLDKDSLKRAYAHMLGYGCDAVTMNWIGYTKNSYSRLAKGLLVSTLVADYSILNGRDRVGFKVFPVGCGTMFKRKAIEEVGEWDYTMIQDDLEIGARLIRRGKRICSSNSPVQVEVPDNFYAFYVQQTRWAMGSTEVLIRRFRDLVKSNVGLLRKVDMFLFLMQYFPFAITFVSALVLSVYGFIGKGDPLNSPIIVIWLLALGSYVYSFVYVARKLGMKLVESLRSLGKLSSYSVAISPFILISIFKAFSGRRTYVVTPKGKITKTKAIYIIGVFGFYFLLASVSFFLKQEFISGLWLAYYSAGYLFAFFSELLNK